MKLYKLKFLLMVVCCAVTALWAEIQCMQQTNQDRKDDHNARGELNQFSARVKRNENLGARNGSMISQQDLLREKREIQAQQKLREQEQQDVQKIAEDLKYSLLQDDLIRRQPNGVLQVINVPNDPTKICECNIDLASSFRSKIQDGSVARPFIITPQGIKYLSFRFLYHDGKHIDF